MGYTVPSAQNIYQYIFRLDKQSRTLTDGFGFSIIFVNDDSYVCRDFISRYFVDLCYRTADRIRIIFFSDLPNSDFEKALSQMYSSHRFDETGMLGAVVNSFSKNSSHSDEIQMRLLNEFLESLSFRDYLATDHILSRISEIWGPRYSDALYRLVIEHKNGDSDVAERQVNELVQKMRNSKNLPSHDPFRRVYMDHWRDLTPPQLTPIDSPERTQTLSYNVQMNTSMPGIGESMLFAARLGIGRFTPCFVFFTDVGELAIDVFPIKDFSAEKIYEQLRTWIDEFYEENHNNIDRWKNVEDEIVKFTRSIEYPFSRLTTWLKKGDELWSELRLSAQLIVELNEVLPNPEKYKLTLDKLQPSTSGCRDVVEKCRKNFAELYKKKNKHEENQQALSDVINKLKDVSDFQIVHETIQLVRNDLAIPSKLLSENGVLNKALNDLGAQQQRINIVDPENELIIWWTQIQESLPLINDYKFNRTIWGFAKDKTEQDIFAEYNSLKDFIFSLPLSDKLEEMMEKTGMFVAGILDTDPNSSEWNKSFATYSYKLKPFLSQLCEKKPIWIHKNETELKVCDVIPFRGRKKVNFKDVLGLVKESDPLFTILQQATINWQKIKKEYVEESIKRALFWRDQIILALSEFQEEPLDLSSEETVAYSTCIRNLWTIRDRSESELVSLANSFSEINNLHSQVENHDVDRFLRLLDEYELAVNHLIYPYKRDSKVQSIKLPGSISFTLDLNVHDQQNSSDHLRSDLHTAKQNILNSSKLFQDGQKRYSTITPSALLAHEISKTTTEKTIFVEDQGKVDSKVPFGVVDVLEKLSDEDLYSVWSSTMASPSREKSRKELIDTLLTITGTISTEFRCGSPDSVSSVSEQRVRLKQLEMLARLEHERIFGMEIDLSITSSEEKRIEIKQRIKRQIIPRLKGIEMEFCQVSLSLMSEEDAEIILLMSGILEIIEASSSDNLLINKNESAKEQLRVALPQIVIYACNEVEPGQPKKAIPVWHGYKSLILSS